MFIGPIPVYVRQISVGKMSVGQTTVKQMSVGPMVFNHKTWNTLEAYSLMGHCKWLHYFEKYLPWTNALAYFAIMSDKKKKFSKYTLLGLYYKTKRTRNVQVL